MKKFGTNLYEKQKEIPTGFRILEPFEIIKPGDQYLNGKNRWTDAMLFGIVVSDWTTYIRPIKKLGAR